jgi:hypothetical protein
MTEEKLVITKSELKSQHIDEIVMMEQAAKRPLSPTERAPVETNLLFNPMVYTAVAGFLGALAAWLLLEPMITKTVGKESGIGLSLMLPVCSMMIGLSVGLIEGLMSRNFFKSFRCGLIGAGVGLAWGVVGIIIAGISFNLLLMVGVMIFPPPAEMTGRPTGGLLFMFITARAVAWTIVAGGMGLGQGTALASKKLLLNGIVGGLMGGFLGGLLFDPIGYLNEAIFPGSIYIGSISRLIGISVIGSFVGFFLGLVESLSKEAWFIMKTGPLRGKQFVIYNNPMVIGSSPKCDIYIFKDPAIEPRHAEVFQVGSKFEIRDCNSPQGIFVNNARVKTKMLEKGDLVVIGESVLEFDSREK